MACQPWFVVIAQCPVAALCVVWREFPPQSSSTLVWFGALPAGETSVFSPPYLQLLLGLGQSGRLGTPFIHFLSQRPDLAQTVQTEPWCWFGLFGWLYMTWLRLCRMSPGVITFQYAHDLAQSPGVIAFQDLTWLSLCRLSPGAWFGLFGWFVYDLVQTFQSDPLRHYFPSVHMTWLRALASLLSKPDLAQSLQTEPNHCVTLITPGGLCSYH